MRKLLSIVLVLFIMPSFIFASELTDFKDLSGRIDIAGGTAHIPVMKEAAQNIMSLNKNITITVTGGGSGVGVKQVGEGLVQIGNTGRALKDSEIEQYGLITYPFAIDGVAVAVHPSNKVSDLTTDMLRDIFAGKINNWKELGGENAPITIYTREDGSGTRDVFVELIMGKEQIVQKAVIVNSNGAMRTALSKDKNAVGYIGIGHVDPQIKGISVNGVEPTQENASSGLYEVTRLLYMNTKGKPSKLTETFINYITDSADGKQIIIKAGYIPLK